MTDTLSSDSINIDLLREAILGQDARHPEFNHFALDIGGSLAKIAYQTRQKKRRMLVREKDGSTSNSGQNSTNNSETSSLSGEGNDLYEYYEEEVEQLSLCFLKFETRYVEACLDFLHDNLYQHHEQLGDIGPSHRPHIKVTGGGAYKYKAMLKEKLPGLKIDKVDEMECMVKGCNFLLQNIPDEIFTYDKHTAQNFSTSCLVNPFPFLLVNIGSGVSILKVSSETECVRVGGTSLGGGTFWGIGSILSNGASFDELLELSDRGDHRKVDMLVRDIYGGDYSSTGLSGEVIASSFGLAARKQTPSQQSSGERNICDLLKSLLITISNNIGQIAYMHAKLHNLQRIIFGGFFIRGHPATMHTLSYAVRFWSSGAMSALFLRHEGYLGAIGAYLKAVDSNGNGVCGKPILTCQPAVNMAASSFTFNKETQDISTSLATSTQASSTEQVVLDLSSTKVTSPTSNQGNVVAEEVDQVFSPGLPGGQLRRQSGVCWSENYFGTTARAFQRLQSVVPIGSASGSSSSTVPPGGSTSVVENLHLATDETATNSSSTARSSPRAHTSASFSGSGPTSPRSEFGSAGGQVVDKLELDLLLDALQLFPLLASPDTYNPDTWDLTQDAVSRDYWLTCFGNGVSNHSERAYESQRGYTSDAKERADGYKREYMSFLQELAKHPSAYGVLTVRCILDAHETFLRQFGFPDPYAMQKKMENKLALALLEGRYSQLNQLGWRERQMELVLGLLAGNVFDWGAQAVVPFIEARHKHESCFDEAKVKLQKRPWLMDDYELWEQRLAQCQPLVSPAYDHVIIFCDNSGFDIMLGVIPFALEFLSMGSRVTLVANSGPALNDVTYNELCILVNRVAQRIPLAARLRVCDNGQCSPCLDLRAVSPRLVQECHTAMQGNNNKSGGDVWPHILIVIVGMGRAIHTNLQAKFLCDSLKVAVIKNAWLAKSLGGDLFSVMFKYETCSPTNDVARNSSSC